MKCIGGTIVDGPTLEMNERGWPASIAVDGYLFEFVEVVDILRQEIKRQNSVKQDPPWNAIVNGTPATLTLDARVAAVENNVDTLRARASDAEVTSRNIRTDVAAVTKKTDGMYHSLAQQGDVIESLARKVAGIETTILKNHFAKVNLTAGTWTDDKPTPEERLNSAESRIRVLQDQVIDLMNGRKP